MRLTILIILLVLSVFSCNNSNEEPEPPKELSLTRIEEFIDDQLVFEHSISYDSLGTIQNVISESEVQTTTYSNQYENGQLKSLELEIVNGDQTYNTGHDIQYFTDETILYERDRNRLMVVNSTGKFLDNVRVYFSSRRDIFFETEFVRDESDNLIEINIYETNQDSERFLSGKFLYSDHSLEHEIPFSLNPVYQDIFFDYQMFYTMGYQLSEQSPFKSVFSSPDASFVDDFASVLFIESSDITGLRRFALTQVNNPDADWRLDLYYQ